MSIKDLKEEPRAGAGPGLRFECVHSPRLGSEGSPEASRPQAPVLKDSLLSLGARQTWGSEGIGDMKLKRWLGVEYY